MSTMGLNMEHLIDWNEHGDWAKTLFPTPRLAYVWLQSLSMASLFPSLRSFHIRLKGHQMDGSLRHLPELGRMIVFARIVLVLGPAACKALPGFDEKAIWGSHLIQNLLGHFIPMEQLAEGSVLDVLQTYGSPEFPTLEDVVQYLRPELEARVERHDQVTLLFDTVVPFRQLHTLIEAQPYRFVRRGGERPWERVIITVAGARRERQRQQNFLCDMFELIGEDYDTLPPVLARECVIYGSVTPNEDLPELLGDLLLRGARVETLPKMSKKRLEARLKSFYEEREPLNLFVQRGAGATEGWHTQSFGNVKILLLGDNKITQQGDSADSRHLHQFRSANDEEFSDVLALFGEIVPFSVSVRDNSDGSIPTVFHRFNNTYPRDVWQEGDPSWRSIVGDWANM